MSQIWVTSDWHFGHDKEFIWLARGFKSVWEMNEEIVYRHNEIVQPNDDVYVLGDLMLGNNKLGLSYIKQLKGNIHVIRGNHDTSSRMNLYKECYNIVEISEGQFLNYNNYHFYLSHYPCLTANNDSDKPLKAKVISLAGHCHYENKFQDMNKGLIYHVEVDAHNCYPVLIDNIIEDIKIYLSGQK